MAIGNRRPSNDRVQITYTPATGDANEPVELPLHLLLIGDYAGQSSRSASASPTNEREPMSVDKDSFDAVLAAHDVRVSADVPNPFAGEGALPVRLAVRTLADFEPDAIVQQVPEAKRLLELRAALLALKAGAGDVSAVRQALAALVPDPGARARLLAALGVGP